MRFRLTILTFLVLFTSTCTEENRGTDAEAAEADASADAKVDHISASDVGRTMVHAKGDYLLAFETRLFRPCGANESWWFVLDPFENGGTIPGWDKAAQSTRSACPAGQENCGSTRVYLEGAAWLSQAGQFGHLGQYDRTIEFIRIDHASAEIPPTCELASAHP